MDNFVNFDSYDDNMDCDDSDYDDRTTLYYKTLRERKMDPIMCIELQEDKAFKFYNKWDPYTGERKEIDPDGPLYFHPHYLIHYFYINRLNDLWIEPSDGFDGSYDIAVGAGEDILIQGRGIFPEKYLFRLPIIDCYLPKNHDSSVITFGPKLLYNEISLINELGKLYGDDYYQTFGYERPDLCDIKTYYDLAIENNNDCDNIVAVEMLKQL